MCVCACVWEGEGPRKELVKECLHGGIDGMMSVLPLRGLGHFFIIENAG